MRCSGVMWGEVGWGGVGCKVEFTNNGSGDQFNIG